MDLKFSPASQLEQGNRVEQEQLVMRMSSKADAFYEVLFLHLFTTPGGQFRISTRWGSKPHWAQPPGAMSAPHFHHSHVDFYDWMIPSGPVSRFFAVGRWIDKIFASFHDRFEGQLRNSLNTAKSIEILNTHTHTHRNLCNCSSNILSLLTSRINFLHNLEGQKNCI